MKKVLSRIVYVIGFCVVLDSATSLTAQEVYLCMGPKSSAYHLTPNCRGLKNCSTQLKKCQKKKLSQRDGMRVAFVAVSRFCETQPSENRFSVFFLSPISYRNLTHIKNRGIS